jgi:hypothetical protein
VIILVDLTHWKRWLWVNERAQLAVSLLYFSIILIPVVIDTIVWIAVIVVGAGNMLVGGLYEAYFDYRIIKYIKKLGDSYPDGTILKIMRELLVTIVSGNLMLEKGGRLATGHDPEKHHDTWS